MNRCVPTAARQRCAQCWQMKPMKDFVSHTGRVVKMCRGCRERYRNWDRRTVEEKIAIHPAMPMAELRGHRVRIGPSHNRKTGAIWVSVTDRSSCPPSCPLFGKGCYAEFAWSRTHWLNVPAVGLGWADFCETIQKLPRGQLWRHNEAGDLPGLGDKLDVAALGMLVEPGLDLYP